ncbi:hypothetical protein [Sphingomonas sp.]|uniref:hypothetical protein n=1 Tax=Sphingomonas sp. TaxID=28214 RepID=UPI002ED9E2A4
MRIGDAGAMAFIPAKASAPGRSSLDPDPPSKADEVVKAFLKEAKKSPIDRMRERILKSHGLTQEQFDALPKEQQGPIQREIEEAMKRALKGSASGSAATGRNADVLA